MSRGFFLARLLPVIGAMAAAVIAVGIVVFITSAESELQASIKITGPAVEQMAEGRDYRISWDAEGLKSVTIIASGERTSIPGYDRGRFNEVIADSVPADSGSTSWTLPFLDTVRFRIIAKGYNSEGILVARDERVYIWRPDVLRTRTIDGIYVDVRNETRQRLYVLKDNKLTKAYLTSGSRSNEFTSINVHPSRPHDHPGVFRIVDKYPVWHSDMFDVDMYWAMRYWNGHFIHGTYRNQYHKLGKAASSGCNRLTRAQSKELYDMTPVGTRVEIIAK